MAALVFETGVATHPQISIKSLDLENGTVVFNWLGGPYGGDCAESFEISVSEHGEMTVSDVIALIVAQMIAGLPQSA